MQPKHAQDKSCGLAAEIQSRIRRCRVFVYRDLIVYPRADEEYQGFSGIVSRETKDCQSELSGSALTVFVRMVLSAYGVESVNMREDAVSFLASQTRVLCPMRA